MRPFLSDAVRLQVYCLYLYIFPLGIALPIDFLVVKCE